MSQLPVRVMICGHFDPFHDGHLSYVEQAIEQSNDGPLIILICVVSSDWQVEQKKGKVNIPSFNRRRIVDLVLSGLGVSHLTMVNFWDTQTTLVAEALRAIKPAIFFRGGDKTPEDMPPEEKQACEALGIEVRYAKYEVDQHGAQMTL